MGDSGKVSKSGIPAIGEIKRAIVEVLASGRQRSFESLEEATAKCLGLSSQQKSFRVAGSKTSLFSNRLEKARGELHREGLIEYPSNGKAKLTESGKEALAESHVEEGKVNAPHGKKASPEKTTTLEPGGRRETPHPEPSERNAGTGGKTGKTEPELPASPKGDSIASPVDHEKRPAGIPSKLPLVLAVLGLALCLTGALAFAGVLCGAASLVLHRKLRYGSPLAKPLFAPKATLASGVCAVVLGALLVVGGAVSGGNHADVQEPPNAARGQQSQAIPEISQHRMSFVVEADGEGDFPSTVMVRITGEQADGGAVDDRRAATVGTPYALSYPAGTYLLEIEQASLANGEMRYKADKESCAFDGSADCEVRISLSCDVEAMQKIQEAKAEAARQKAEEEAAAARAAEEAAAAAAIAEADSAAAAASSNDSGGYTVYITRTGEKYHAGGCQYLKKSKIPIAVSDARAQGYEPCSRCDP